MSLESEIIQSIVGDGILAVIIWFLMNRIEKKVEEVLYAVNRLLEKE
jgi:hypothetical protein